MSNRALLLTRPLAGFHVTSREIPQPTGSRIVIRNHAIALDPVNWKISDIPGQAGLIGLTDLPNVIGNNVAGIVQAVGPDVTRFKPGDRVLGMAWGNSNDSDRGGFQEYVLLDEYMTGLVPEKLGFAEAAKLPTAVLTAEGMLFDIGITLDPAGKPADQPELALVVFGGSSSVGTSAIQFAKAYGGVKTVIATASSRNAEYVKALGADAVVDYNAGSLAEGIRAAAASLGATTFKFIDAASADIPGSSKAVSELGGRELPVITPPGDGIAEGVKVWFSGAAAPMRDPKRGAAVLHELTARGLESGRLKPHRVQLMSGGLDGIEKALATLKKGVSGTKIVVELA